MKMIRPRFVAAAATALVTVTLLSACGAPPWTQSLSGSSGRTGSSDSQAISTPRATDTPAAVVTLRNDLAAGSTHRTLTAGSLSIDAKYWSTLDMGDWTPGADKPISLSLSAAISHSAGQKVFLSRATMQTQVTSKKGASLPAPAAAVDDASIDPGYAVQSPYSYGDTFVLPAVDSRARQVVLTFTYEFLVQTTPTSTTYAKQTATDSITIQLQP